jgi:nucleoside-diphosphate-sugar epimerase
MIYILGINGFIARNLYLKLKQKKTYEITCLSHDELHKLSCVTSNDIVINFCGINRGKTMSEYDNGNHIFVKNMVDLLKQGNVEPYVIHVSSLMVRGFMDRKTEELPEYQQNFINSKLNGEKYLVSNYINNKLCIIRPSNIYGYDCEPYYNNILVTLVHEKIINTYKINKINKNCLRNFLSIDGLCIEIQKLIENRTFGIFNIVSNNDVTLDQLVKTIHQGNIPKEILIEEGDHSIPNNQNNEISEKQIIHMEFLEDEVRKIENKMVKYLKLSREVDIKKLNRLSQPRGDMIEISALSSNRLYMITLSDHSIRGNHYHFKQIEHFYQLKGKVMFLLIHKDDLDIVLFRIINEDTLVTVNPLIIHTLINDFYSNTCEVIVTSTQPFISDSIPDTEYINIF